MASAGVVTIDGHGITVTFDTPKEGKIARSIVRHIIPDDGPAPVNVRATDTHPVPSSGHLKSKVREAIVTEPIKLVFAVVAGLVLACLLGYLGLKP